MQRGRRILEEHYNLEDALVVATMLNTFVNNADTVKIANMAQIVNVIAPIFTNEKGMFLHTIYYPLRLFAANTRGIALETFVESPACESKTHGKARYLDVSASLNGGVVTINVVNRHLDREIEAEIEIQDGAFTGSFEVQLVTGPDIKAENDFGKTTVKAEKTALAASGGRMRHRFPGHSYTMLKGNLA
jgi:alpha-N-arabinofuranosidase